MSTEEIDLENWMGKLSENLREKVGLANLAIPGTHNSMTYNISKNSKLAPDATNVISHIYKLSSKVVRNWAKTQNCDVFVQLNHGIRYFDLRIGKSKSGEIAYCHGVFSVPFRNTVTDWLLFLKQHPKEFIILDFQHFYNINEHDHGFISGSLINIFGDILIGPGDSPFADLTLAAAFEMKKQIMVIYRSRSRNLKFYSEYSLYTPWPNVANTKKLINFLDRVLLYRNINAGLVCQCIITPNAGLIIKKLFSSLEKVSRSVNKAMSEWIQKQAPGSAYKGSINIILLDFIDYQNYEICKSVVGLNYKIGVFQSCELVEEISDNDVIEIQHEGPDEITFL